MNAPFDAAHPTKTPTPASYPRPKCDPKKTFTYSTTSAAANPEITTDPSLVYRGTRPHRPPSTIPKQPIQSPYPPLRVSNLAKQHSQQQQQHSQQQQQQEQQTQPQVQTSTSSTPPTTTSPSFISQPAARRSRYPQHPHSQVRSVCSPAARFANPYAFGVHRATHTKH